MTMAEETLRGDRDVRHLNTGDGLTDMQVTNTTNYEKNFGVLFTASNWGRLFKVCFQKLQSAHKYTLCTLHTIYCGSVLPQKSCAKKKKKKESKKTKDFLQLLKYV